MVTGNGNKHSHHKYEECPNCKKKGVYKPLSEVLRNGKLMIFPKTCKFCLTMFGKAITKD